MSRTAMTDVLLTPSESNAFDSFLQAMDNYDPNAPASTLGLSAEWSMYSTSASNHIHIHEGKEDLAKATKDLISFGESTATGAPSAIYAPVRGSQFNPNQAMPKLGTNLPRNLHSAPPQSYLQDARSWPSVPAAAGFKQPQTSFGSTDFRNGALGPAPSQTLFNAPPRPTLASLSTTISLPSGSSASPTSSHSLTTPASAASHRNSASRKRPSLDINTHSLSAPAGLDSTSSNKRPKLAPSSGQDSSGKPLTIGLEPDPAPRSSVSRQNVSSGVTRKTSSSAKKSSPESRSSSEQTPPPQASSSRPQLLSAAQKKLNHIHSEQKRRANIRRGYDALCDVVPALRDAIRADDAACASSGKKRGRGKLLGEDGEKLDGRAGPRSESVVLQKTIEYMEDLELQRSSLMERLHAARSRFPPGHPAVRTAGEMPWERIWNGGVGLPLNGAAMDDDQYGEDDSDDGE